MRPFGRRSVGVFAGRGQLEKTELTDLHPRVQHDRQRGNVAQLQRHVAGEPGVHEAGRRVRQQTEPTQRRLALHPCGDVVRQGDRLVGRAEDELTGVQDERLVAVDLDQPGQVRLIQRGVNDRVFVVVEQPKVAIEAEVHTRGLHHGGIPGVQTHPAGVNLGVDVAIREQHRNRLAVMWSRARMVG